MRQKQKLTVSSAYAKQPPNKCHTGLKGREPENGSLRTTNEIWAVGSSSVKMKIYRTSLPPIIIIALPFTLNSLSRETSLLHC